MAHDVFISYSSKNKVVANALCHYLEEYRIRCWIAPRDIPPGRSYADEIDSAIINCKVFIIIFSKDSATSKWCPGEVNIAFDENKIIIPFRIDDHPLRRDMRVYLGSKHWIDACPDPEKLFGKLSSSIQAILNQDDATPETVIPPQPEPSIRPSFVTAPPEKKAGKRTKLYLLLALAPVLLLVFALAAIQVKSLFSPSDKSGIAPAVGSTAADTPAQSSTPAIETGSSLQKESISAQTAAASSSPVTETVPEGKKSTSAQTAAASSSPAEEKTSDSAEEPKVLNLLPGSLLSVFPRNTNENTLDPQSAPLEVIVDNNEGFDISSLINNPGTNQKFVTQHNRVDIFSRSLFLVWEGYFQADAEDTYFFSLVPATKNRFNGRCSAEIFFSKDKSPSLSISFSSTHSNTDTTTCSKRLMKGVYRIRIIWKVISSNSAPPSFIFEYRRQSDPTTTVRIKPSNLLHESPSE